jgi:hypothetical protein
MSSASARGASAGSTTVAEAGGALAAGQSRRSCPGSGASGSRTSEGEHLREPVEVEPPAPRLVRQPPVWPADARGFCSATAARCSAAATTDRCSGARGRPCARRTASSGHAERADGQPLPPEGRVRVLPDGHRGSRRAHFAAGARSRARRALSVAPGPGARRGRVPSRRARSDPRSMSDRDDPGSRGCEQLRRRSSARWMCSSFQRRREPAALGHRDATTAHQGGAPRMRKLRQGGRFVS